MQRTCVCDLRFLNRFSTIICQLEKNTLQCTNSNVFFDFDYLRTMVKTKKTSLRNKDYCQKYRTNNKEVYRKRDRERKTVARNYMKFLESEKYECKKKAERERLRLYRLRKKLEKKKPISSSNETTNKESQSASSSSFTNKQSLSRSLKKAEKALLFSPGKKRDVISGLAEKYKLRIKFVEKRGRKAHVLTEQQQEWLIDAFD